MCELSPFTTQNVYSWQVFDTTDVRKLWLWPQEQYITPYTYAFCFPNYLNPLIWYYDSSASTYDLWGDFVKAVTSINKKF